MTKTANFGAFVFLLAAAMGLAVYPSPARSQDSITKDPEAVQLQFAFERVPWRDVIRWVAEEGDLALHYEDLPTGSFTYSDPNAFAYQDAIDRLNLFLLPQGYALVQSGKLLSVINLGDPRSMQQLDALAELVTADQLEERSPHDVVKCLFPLGELKAEDAVEELSVLSLMTTPAVFNKTNQIMITDSVAKLRNVKAILDAFAPSTLQNGTVIKSFSLEHVSAEDILVVARPHLGLATDEMIGIDVSLSADLQGKNIFVTGVEDKVKLIENLVASLDKPAGRITVEEGGSILQSHSVEGGNIDTIYNVLQTLLAGKSLRLSIDKEAGAIVALASADVQEEIAATVTQLKAAEAAFEVIPLKTVDPYLAVSLLEQMLDLPETAKERERMGIDVPKIDADPGNMRLYVRGKKHEIDQIKKIVEGLDVAGTTDGEQLRVFPMKGKAAIEVLETTVKFWREENPVIFYPSEDEASIDETERVTASDSTSSKLVTVSTNERDRLSPRYLTDNLDSQEPAIRCQLTARGLLLQCEDTLALSLFEDRLRTIAGPGDSIPSPPIVFYLKYTKPDDALRMLAELLDGGESAREGAAGTLINGYVSSSSSFLGSIVASREGTTTMMAGSITVVADSRLNRLIAQGTTSDIETIENYLKIIDKDSSITEIKTYGTSHVIELIHTSASEVAAAIREAYAGRMGGGGAAGPAGKQAQAAPQKEPQRDSKEEGDKRVAASKPVKNLEPQMTLAVHEPSNSLIVTAPEQLFLEVQELAMLIDSRSEQTMQVLSTEDSAMMQAIFQTGSSESRSRSSNNRSSQDSSRSRNQSQISDLLRSKFGR